MGIIFYRKQFGKGVKKGKLSKGKVPLKRLRYICENHHIPTRRPLTDYEMILRDRTRSRNKESRRKYSEFIKTGKVIIYNVR